eukprot:g2554.t1
MSVQSTTAAAKASATHIRSMFRHMLRLSKLLTPESKRTTTLERVRSGFRENATLTEAAAVEKKMQEAEAHLDFLRILTPKHKLRGLVDRGNVKIVSRKGVLVETDSSSRGSSTHKGEWNKDPEVLAWHHRLARRQYFMDR